WDAPGRTMMKFSDTRREDLESFTMSHNLFWNGGASIPMSAGDAVNYTCDRDRVVANPGLADPRGLVPPRWVPEKKAFADGSTSIDAVKARLVDRFARPATDDDIRGKKRGDHPDIGAFEVGDAAPRPALARRSGRAEP